MHGSFNFLETSRSVNFQPRAVFTGFFIKGVMQPLSGSALSRDIGNIHSMKEHDFWKSTKGSS